MRIELNQIGRRYNRNWIFKGVNATLENDIPYAILGPNGSGKSTFLKILSGALTPSEGTIHYYQDNREIDIENIYTQVSISAPYVELLDDFTLTEMVDFHLRFKTLLPSFSKSDVLAFLQLDYAQHRQLRYFSSGMKQRVKLALACFVDSPLLLLDEPASNLDSAGEQWYLQLIEKTRTKDRILVIASNRKEEYAFCQEYIQIMDYK